MAPTDTQDFEVEGVTSFAPPPAPTYRYVIKLENNKMSIWMEDRSSKKQWYKGGLDKSDYVTSSNAITDASASDYMKCFQDSLDCEVDDSGDVQRKLVGLKNGVLRLEFTVKIRVLRSAWMTKYLFDLDPVSVERVDVLESKLRDQQDELEKLRRVLHAYHETVSFNLEASQLDANSNQYLCWNKIESKDIVVSGNDGVIKILLPGVYSLSGIVNVVPTGYNQQVELLRNGERIQTSFCLYGQGYNTSTPLQSTTRLEEDDEVKIRCACNISASYMSVVRLGS
ncbi:hypothetical protein PHYBOEH_000377 [Phytophthora boehmeriae]|uniref:Uncharacterized protein n=1 Tax=Phytophthora boehmeriae TaxID=109152 RepID=A0A8T1VAX5_9STRA|nr:hypothetical protein PHYBOEH_000377 [Phytophthora boehmeriae]